MLQQWIQSGLEGVGVALPDTFQSVMNDAATNLGPWRCVEPGEAQQLQQGLHDRYPIREVLPFARRTDSDDVACFVTSDGERLPGSVLIIHDFASPGWEVEAEMDSFSEWYARAMDDAAEFDGS